MQKSLIKDNTKKDVPLILCIIYFSYLIFKIFIQKEITGTDNSILKTMYFFRMDKLLFCVPILYYFIKTNKEKKYFKVNKKLNITDIVTYFALIYGINFFLNLISSAINIEGQKFIVQRPIYGRNCISWCSDDIFEKIWNSNSNNCKFIIFWNISLQYIHDYSGIFYRYCISVCFI